MVAFLAVRIGAQEPQSLVCQVLEGDQKDWVAARVAQPFPPGNHPFKIAARLLQAILRWLLVRNLRVASQDGWALIRSSVTIVQPHY